MSFRTKPASDVFAGGDVVTGPAFVIHAIAAGKEGAVSIHRYVHPGQTQNLGRDRRIFTSLDKTKAALAIGGYDTAPRQKAAVAGADKARKTMDDLRGTFTEEQMKKRPNAASAAARSYSTNTAASAAEYAQQSANSTQ